MTDFAKNELTQPSRLGYRGNYDRNTIYAIMDEALDCTVSYLEGGIPKAIPTGFVRIDDKLYIHGSIKSHFIQQICSNPLVCITISLLDGMVLANTAFNHSFNYRGIVAFSTPNEVKDESLKLEVLRLFTNKVLPGRWEDNIVKPTVEETISTSVICLPLNDASAKIREGQPKNQANATKEVWTGYIPIRRVWEAPVISPDVPVSIKQPDYITLFVEQQ